MQGSCTTSLERAVTFYAPCTQARIAKRIGIGMKDSKDFRFVEFSERPPFTSKHRSLVQVYTNLGTADCAPTCPSKSFEVGAQSQLI